MKESNFTFADLKSIKRDALGKDVPLELFRAIRLIGMYQGLPLNGRGTTTVVGKTIGQSLPVSNVEELLKIFQDLRIGIPTLLHQDERHIHIAVDDCFCEGLAASEGNFICDLEGSILAGSLSKILGKDVQAKEVKCNVNGDERCEYELTIR